MAIKLSETQSSLMGAAAQRDDRLFSLPEGRSKAAARKAASELLAKGWAREVRAQGEAPIWRHDKDSQRAFALKLTAVGAKAIATVAGDGKTGSQPKPPREIEATPNARRGAMTRRGGMAKRSRRIGRQRASSRPAREPRSTRPSKC